MSSEPNDLLDPNEAAALLGIGYTHLVTLAKQGKVPSITIAQPCATRKRMFRRSRLLALMGSDEWSERRMPGRVRGKAKK